MEKSVENSVVYYLVKRTSEGKLRSFMDTDDGQPYAFGGRMLPDRLARALRADGWPYFVISIDLAVEEPQILPRFKLA